jgi:hypothetical protein
MANRYFLIGRSSKPNSNLSLPSNISPQLPTGHLLKVSEAVINAPHNAMTTDTESRHCVTEPIFSGGNDAESNWAIIGRGVNVLARPPETWLVRRMVPCRGIR